MIFQEVRKLDPAARNSFFASFLGWTLDAFDYFILPLTTAQIAADFHAPVPMVIAGTTLTLALRPVGALIFGALADRYGRRVPLMIDILLFSVLELASAFAPNLATLLVLRALFGIAMGGEWGLGAALALESLPAESRGLFSGLLQQGYAVGYLLAALVMGLAFSHIGWRGMFALGALPALLVLFIRSRVPESPAWSKGEHARTGIDVAAFFKALGSRWKLFLYAIVLMAVFNAMSHGTQDNYSLLLRQHGLNTGQISVAVIIANLGAIAGGTLFGVLSQTYGRRNMIVAAAAVGLAVVFFWAHAAGLVFIAAAGFAMQFAVQGAWGIIPAHLNELAPDDIRASFPGVSYQLGNLLASWVAQLEGTLAAGPYKLPDGEGDYARALFLFVSVALILTACITALGPERKNARLS